MHSKWILYMAVVIAAATVVAEASRVILRQLTADQVRTVLKAADREDAVPEGRVITQGIAALSGFGLGVAKGVAGSILFDVVTSNATLQWLASLNLTSLLPGGTSGSGASINSVYQEICFGTKGRSLESDVPEAQGRQDTTPTPPPTTPTTTNPGPTTGEPPTTDFPTTTNPTLTTDNITPSSTSGPSPTVSPSPSVSPSSGVSPTTPISPAPSASPSPSPSNTDSVDGKTCIVIQKPKARRRRRSVRRKRLLSH